ncbi:Hypothetical protein PHPALM_17694 [Phytophthora palmivora]|uniref:Retrotransposon gag domain-containing protein n=1 Tax=Phytophthora palmivora TaxID=4796 RepID=A0A2P4XLK5_9STRA|nr:Hypothetical protein PHPALM_17694 [Phytophthora palmivora]
MLVNLLRYHNVSLFINGTFRCVPRNFQQCVVFMVHDRSSGLYIPVFYILSTSRSADADWDMMHFVLQATYQQLSPADVVCDFEPALVQVVQTQFRDAIVLGCLFRMKQALRRAMKKYAILDTECSIAMTKGVIGMLIVVNPDHRCEKQGIAYSNPKWEVFWLYFEHTWIVGNSVELWNLIARTNNPLERFNRVLNSRFPKRGVDEYQDHRRTASVSVITPTCQSDCGQARQHKDSDDRGDVDDAEQAGLSQQNAQIYQDFQVYLQGYQQQVQQQLQAHSAQREHKIEGVTMPMYHGRPHKSVDEFIFRAKLFMQMKCIDFTNPHNGPRVLAMLAANFRDGAASWHHAKVMVEHVTYITLDELHASLTAEFVPPDQQFRLRAELRQCKQSGSVDDFVKDFRRVMAQIQCMHPLDQVDHFCEGLKSETKKEVMYLRCATLADAIAAAQAYERTHFSLEQIC